MARDRWEIRDDRRRLFDIWATLTMEQVDLERTAQMLEKEFPEDARAVVPTIEKLRDFKREEANKVKAAMDAMEDPV